MRLIKKNKITNIKHIHSSDDKKISLALLIPFIILTIQYFILICFNMLETENASRLQLFSKILVGLAFAYAAPVVFKKNKINLIGVYLLLLCIFTIHYLFFVDNRIYIQSLLFPFFFMSLPAFIYALSIHDLNILKQSMKMASYIVFTFGAILSVLVIAGKASMGLYSMSLSYYILLPAIMFIDELLDHFSMKILLFSAISMLIIIVLGSRGAILCITVFFLLKLTRTSTILSYKKYFIYLSTLFTVSIGYVFFNEILEMAYNFLLTFGIRSRSISLFLNNTIYLSGRDILYKIVLKNLSDNPLLGLGIGGDRAVLDGAYTHNIFIELMTNFGIVSGTIIIGVLVFLIIKVFFTKDMLKYNLFIIWFSLGFVHLMVSSSYLIDLKFWIFLGILLNRKKYIALRSFQSRLKKNGLLCHSRGESPE